MFLGLKNVVNFLKWKSTECIIIYISYSFWPQTEKDQDRGAAAEDPREDGLGL